MKSINALKQIAVLLSVFLSAAVQSETIELSGEWTYQLDRENVGVEKKWYLQNFTKTLQFPGTLDENKIGDPVEHKIEMTKEGVKELARYYEYTGAAWYQKKIKVPRDWKGKSVDLLLERVLWQSKLWVNGRYVAMQDSLSAPHKFDLSEYIKPGKVNTLTVRIDNSYIHDVSQVWGFYGAHAYTNGTQTIWNGIVGDMELTAREAVWVQDVQIYTNQADKKLSVNLTLANTSGAEVWSDLALEIQDSNGVALAPASHSRKKLSKDVNHLSIELPMVEQMKLWDEFDPNLYRLHVVASTKSEKRSARDESVATFGVRDFSAQGTQFAINGRKTFLRGTLECAIFPNIGYPPTDVESWLKLYGTAKEWGFNHIRYHSYTPPKAAFEAADQLGMYLQIELPLWKRNIGEENTESRDQYLLEEADHIIDTYGNHPSFVLMAMGNELEGVDADLGPMHRIVEHLQKRDNRHLYTTTSFSFTSGRAPEPVDEFFVTQYTDQGRKWVRGQRDYGELRPGSTHNYSGAIEGVELPLLSHEIGQYAVYPNLREIPKYTGVTRPVAFEAIQKDLKEKGLLDQADDFTHGSGHMAAYLYRAEVESALRTPGFAGFQFLSLSDFPGQSTATIGLLDAFWDSKGFIEAEEFTRFNAPTVPLLRTEKYVYTNNEHFAGDITLSHFGREPLQNVSLSWKVTDTNGDILFSGKTVPQDISLGNDGASLGDVTFPLQSFSKPVQLNIEVGSADLDIANDWNIWVYPQQNATETGEGLPQYEGILVTRNLDEKAQKVLDDGGKVLMLPTEYYQKDSAVKGSFLPVFWSPVHFPTNTPMGIIADTQHPALTEFPTGKFADWQWWELLNNAAAINLDALSVTPTPIVQMIPNFFNNSMNAYVFEAEVSKGKLLVLSMDVETDLDQRPVARQLKSSILSYMQGSSFQPEVRITVQDAASLVLSEPRETGLAERQRGPE
ncbi:sugar-binding domain-containing protein [Microbulbifer sp. 2205BS26-8]|uniref:sugar-binding domain-containing protein n=1 Tax=Microbulbifer sp. 2205BS26-8 TaxID=3064386 RepID=UPI00273E112F|nr:sugar-binding domain-containing protein [Microbulbifer sp. 2205BS26-8]MDP5210801.1 hypothetical protein [Microbulbifer sp. 2205BS26-8]